MRTSAIPMRAGASYVQEKPILKMVHCADYVEQGEPVWFQVGVENADKFRNISYHWLFTVESCIGSYSSSGAFNWTVGDTDDGFYYAELVEWLQRNDSGSGWHKMEAGETFKEGLYADNIYINALDDHHFNYTGRTAVTETLRSPPEKTTLSGPGTVWM